MATPPRAHSRGERLTSIRQVSPDGPAPVPVAHEIAAVYDPLKYPSLLAWSPEDVSRERAGFFGYRQEQWPAPSGAMVVTRVPFNDFDVLLGLLQAAHPGEHLVVVVNGYELSPRHQAAGALFEAHAEVRAMSSGTERQLLRLQASGPAMVDAIHFARWWAVRTCLFGDVMLTGVLLDLPHAWARLDIEDPVRRRYRLRGWLLPSEGGTERLQFDAAVIHDRPSPGARASYQRVIKAGFSPRLRACMAPYLDFKPTLRLHRLILALARHRVIGQHGHHGTHISNDARLESLLALPPEHHAKQHSQFATCPDGTGAYQGYDRFQLANVGTYLSDAIWPRRWAMDAEGRHTLQVLSLRDATRMLEAMETRRPEHSGPDFAFGANNSTGLECDADTMGYDRAARNDDQSNDSAVDTWLTPEQVATLLQRHPDTVRRMLVAGMLPGHKIGRRWRISARELSRWQRSISSP